MLASCMPSAMRAFLKGLGTALRIHLYLIKNQRFLVCAFSYFTYFSVLLTDCYWERLEKARRFSCHTTFCAVAPTAVTSFLLFALKFSALGRTLPEKLKTSGLSGLWSRCTDYDSPGCQETIRTLPFWGFAEGSFEPWAAYRFLSVSLGLAEAFSVENLFGIFQINPQKERKKKKPSGCLVV